MIDWKMSKGQIILSIIVTAGFLALSAIVVWFARGGGEVPASLEKFWLMVFTAWTVNFTTIINWNFGSSKGSAEKNAIIANKQAGFATLRALAAVALIGLFVVVMFGCAQVEKIWNPTGKSVCDDPDCATGSLICKVTAERGMTPEALNGILLDSAALDVVFQPQNRDDICGFLADLKIIYNPQMLWADLIQFTELSAEQSAALAAVIQRRIPLAELAVNRFISECDDKMLRAGWAEHWEQLNCDAVRLE